MHVGATCRTAAGDGWQHNRPAAAAVLLGNCTCVAERPYPLLPQTAHPHGDTHGQSNTQRKQQWVSVKQATLCNKDRPME